MFLILNRFPRGMYSIGAKFNGVVLGLLTYFFFHNPYVAIAVAIGYALGESFGWGLWVGCLTEHREATTNKTEDEGANNGIQWLSRKIVPNYLDNFVKYCRVALTIRGLYWWTPTLLPLYFVGFSAYDLLISIIVLSISFPLACELGYLVAKKYSFKFLELSSGWTWQEVIYGGFQDIVLISLILTKL